MRYVFRGYWLFLRLHRETFICVNVSQSQEGHLFLEIIRCERLFEFSQKIEQFRTQISWADYVPGKTMS